MTPAQLRPLAEADLVERTEYYNSVGGDNLGARFFDAAIVALKAVGQMPGIGSPRVGEMCGIVGLRVRRIADFPCGWFYFERPNHVDVVRLLGYAQNLPAILAEVDG